MRSEAPVAVERIERAILVSRGHKVLLDSDLAAPYEIETRVRVQAVKRNLERFPVDFTFQLSVEEVERLTSQSVMSNAPGRGGRRTAPYAFTEQGVATLSRNGSCADVRRIARNVPCVFWPIRAQPSSDRARRRHKASTIRRAPGALRPAY